MAESYDYISFLFGLRDQWNNCIKRRYATLLKIDVKVRKCLFFTFRRKMQLHLFFGGGGFSSQF